MRPEARKALEEALGSHVEFDAPISRHVALRIGGPADAIATPETREELSELMRICAEHDLPTLPLGGGFNTLALDAGIDGVIVRTAKLRDIEALADGVVRAEAGVSHRQLINFCNERGLAGLEFAAGIPGTIGGWIAMNAGVGWREMVDVVRNVEIVSARGSAQRIEAGELAFRYRGIDGLPEGAVIVAACFELTASTPAAVSAEVDRLLAERAKTQPLDVPSCGSVFKNPEGDYAGRLIESVGLKGLRAGGAQISEVHANFIANLGGATSADVLTLVRRAQSAVLEESGVELSTEVRIVGRGA
jgi:UDP-N-acetylmuramate dehydrogenase